MYRYLFYRYCVPYEMLVGQPPFNGETAVSIAIKHIQDSVPNVTTDVRKDIPQSLSNVILRATEKDKANRYKTIQEMKDDLVVFYMKIERMKMSMNSIK